MKMPLFLPSETAHGVGPLPLSLPPPSTHSTPTRGIDEAKSGPSCAGAPEEIRTCGWQIAAPNQKARPVVFIGPGDQDHPGTGGAGQLIQRRLINVEGPPFGWSTGTYSKSYVLTGLLPRGPISPPR